MATGKMECTMDMANVPGPMDIYTRVNGKRARPMGRVLNIVRMEVYDMRECFETTNQSNGKFERTSQSNGKLLCNLLYFLMYCLFVIITV